MNRKARSIMSKLLTNIVIIVIGFAMLYPVLWLFSASFKVPNTIFGDAGLIPKAFTWDNYAKGWKGIGIYSFGTFFKNSFVISLLCVAANALFCSLTAYAFARLDFVGKKVWFAVMLVTMMLPGHVTTIPRYVLSTRSDGSIRSCRSSCHASLPPMRSSSSCWCSSSGGCPVSWTNRR